MTALNFPAAPSDGQVYDNFVYDAAKGAWKLQVIAGNDLTDLNDVSITTPSDGQALVYDLVSESWVNETPATTLEGLTDTSITSPAPGETIIYDGGSWANQEVPPSVSPFLLGGM